MLSRLAFWFAVGFALALVLDWLRVKMQAALLITETDMVLKNASLEC